MLYTKLKTDLVAAQKSGDVFVTSVLKLILSELSYAQVDYKQGELPDDMVEKVLFKEAKKRKDSIAIYEKISNKERVEAEKAELVVIESYLPKQMSSGDIEVEIDKIAKETGLASGRLVGAVMGKLKGKADSSVVLEIVSRKYSN